MIFRAHVLGGQYTSNPDNFYIFLQAESKLNATDTIQSVSGVLWGGRDDYKFIDVMSEDELQLMALEGTAFQDAHLMETLLIDGGIIYVSEAVLLLVGQDRLRIKLALARGLQAMEYEY